MTKRHHNVLAVYSLRDKAARDSFSGVLDALSNKSDWHLTVVRPWKHFTPAELLDDEGWPYDGFLIPLPGTDETMQRLSRLQKPMVLVNITDRRLTNHTGRVSTVWLDNMEIGRRAAQYLLNCGTYRSAGYVHELHDEFYSNERFCAFRQVMNRASLTTEAFSPPDSPRQFRTALRKWIKSLPKPTAIMAVSDMRAADVINACRTERLSIPDDVAIVGVDNDLSQHRECGMTITSVLPDFHEMGRLAARELDRLFYQKKPPAPLREILVPVRTIVEGASTPRSTAQVLLIQRALTDISNHLSERIRPADVARRLGCSRKLLDLRFREARQSTLRKEIERIRLEEAIRMRKDGETVKSVVSRLHFTSANQFYRIYKRHFGRKLTQSL